MGLDRLHLADTASLVLRKSFHKNGEYLDQILYAMLDTAIAENPVPAAAKPKTTTAKR